MYLFICLQAHIVHFLFFVFTFHYYKIVNVGMNKVIIKKILLFFLFRKILFFYLAFSLVIFNNLVGKIFVNNFIIIIIIIIIIIFDIRK